MKMTTIMCLAFVALLAIISVALFSGSALAAEDYTTPDLVVAEQTHMFVKNIMIWFMLMLVAFLMIFIKKYEWGVALAVLVSAAGAFIVYLALAPLVFGLDGLVYTSFDVWNQELMLMGVICAITVVIAIGCFLGTLKMWQYLVVGILFAFMFVFLVWMFDIGIGKILGDDLAVADPGGSMLVHMCAAYFGLGVAWAMKEKRAFNEPMYTTTHSVSFVWLAAMLLWVLWPAFVTALLPMDQVFWGMMVCYLGGIGSMLSAWIVCTALQKKVNPLIYTYAMLAGPVAIGTPLIFIGPWVAIIVGILAGIISALSFIYLHPWLCKKLGAVDVMGVHNLHGVAGVFGGIVGIVMILILGDVASARVGFETSALANVLGLAFAFLIPIAFGIVVGFLMKAMRGDFPDEHMFSDEADFIRNDEP